MRKLFSTFFYDDESYNGQIRGIDLIMVRQIFKIFSSYLISFHDN